ncbi:MAG: shikimate dehydrogenase [Elusimicrobiota bacterium]
MNVSGSTRVTGIFGYPVKHTLSPAMHNAAFQALRLNFVYLPFEVKPENLRSCVNAIRSFGFAGVNITIPYKEKVIACMDELDPLAKTIGSVNTIVNHNGKLTGYNTDGSGFLKDLKKHGVNVRNKKVILLGAGGAGRAVASVLSRSGISRIYITDSNEMQAEKLRKIIPKSEYIKIEKWKDKISCSDILINATPVGMHPGGQAPANAEDLKKDLFVYDLVYNRRTELLREAEKAGAKFCGGLGMLLSQGMLAFELWTGKKAPLNVMKKALLKTINKSI